MGEIWRTRSTVEAGQSELHGSQFAKHSHAEIAHLLDFLPGLYPGGDAWLTRRLAEVDANEAVMVSARVRGELAGIAIGKRKSGDRFKMCTLFVREGDRNAGIGTKLASQMVDVGVQSGASEIYITAAHTVAGAVGRTIQPFGFEHIATELDRYGPGRDECVFAVRSANVAR